MEPMKQPTEDTPEIYSASNKSLSKMINQRNMWIIWYLKL